MIKILTISLGLRDVQIAGMTVSGEVIAVGICFVITVAYSVAAGMWAVLWTDLVQFVIKMTAVIVLAVYAVRAVGGMDALKAELAAHFGSETAALSVLPVQVHAERASRRTRGCRCSRSACSSSVQWWAAWYPGAEPGGGGYVAQRIFSAKTERDGVLATLFFQVAHYALRPWPWIITGLATVMLYPERHRADARPRSGVRAGVRRSAADAVARLHDGRLRRRVHVDGRHAAQLGRVVSRQRLLQAFPQQDGDARSTTSRVSRWATVVLFLAVDRRRRGSSTSVEGAWEFLLALGAGTGLVLILRWYWWRINAWSRDQRDDRLVRRLGVCCRDPSSGRVVPGRRPADRRV